MITNKVSAQAITAIVIGNAIEWYDSVVYSFMMVYIAKLYFPAVNEINSLLAATATFGVAFCARPIGGIILGMYADKKGRKSAITLVIAIMTVALLLIATAPTYRQAGIAAPCILLFARLLQGFSTGGEFGTATALLAELSPPEKRGFYCSWQMAGQTSAMILGAATGMFLTNFLSTEQLQTWGWRIPFILGLIIAPFGIYIRRRLEDTSQNSEPVHFGHETKQHLKNIFIAAGLVAGGTAATYINLSHMPTYAHEYLHFSMNEAFTGTTLGGIVIILFIPFFGWLSDSIGRKPILLSAVFLYLILIYPLFFWLFHSPSLIRFITVQFIICFLLSAYFGVFAAIVAELFPKKIRSTGLSISYNFAVMLFGGFAQFIVTYLIHVTGTPLAVTYYLMFTILLTLIATIYYKEKEETHEQAQLALAAHRI